MSDEIVDIELFIDEVKTRPVIWDVSHEDYKNRIKKQSAWEQICESMIENFSQRTETEKNATIKKLAQKWKNLKDNYSRSVRKNTKSGQPTGAGRQYLYTRQLSFLQASMALATTHSTLENTDDNDSPHSQFQQDDEEVRSLSESATSPALTLASTSPSTSVSSTGAASKRQREFESSLLRFINAADTVEPPDEDKSFFDSLIPTIKTFNEDQKLDFRSEVLDVVKRIKRKNQTQIPSLAVPSPTYHPMFSPSYHQFRPTQSQQINIPPPQYNLLPTSAIQNTAADATISSLFVASNVPSICTTTATSPDICTGFYSSLDSLPQPSLTTDNVELYENP